MPTGNVTWKALKKLPGIDDEYRMILMSMVGTAIFITETGGPAQAPVVVPSLDISIEQLVGKQNSSANLNFPVWRCDTNTDDGCLHPYMGNVNDHGDVPSFRDMVKQKLWAIEDKIANRQSHENLSDVIGFINLIDLPVYKMVAIGTSFNNTGLADAMIDRNLDLIAAKYAEVYIRSSVADLIVALVKYRAVATNVSISDQIKAVIDEAEKVKTQARNQLSAAYTQATNTSNIIQEVQFMEKTMNANLSQTLRNSLIFGRNLR